MAIIIALMWTMATHRQQSIRQVAQKTKKKKAASGGGYNLAAAEQ
jgi:hypothetical protein